MPTPKGVRYGGRQKGTKNKSTIERQLRAEAAMAVDKASSTGSPHAELAKDALVRYRKICESAAAELKPRTAKEIATGQEPNPDGDWTQFGAWLDRAIYCAKERAKYESPTMRAVVVQQADPGASPSQWTDDELQAALVNLRAMAAQTLGKMVEHQPKLPKVVN